MTAFPFSCFKFKFLPVNSFLSFFLCSVKITSGSSNSLRIRGCTSKCITMTIRMCCPENKRKQTEGSEWELNTTAACLCAEESLSGTQPGEITKDLRMWVKFPTGYTFWGGSSAEATRAMRRFLSSSRRFFRPGSISATTIKLPRTVLWNSAAVVLRRHQENRGNWWGRFGFTHRVRKNPTGESRGAGAGGG